MKKIFAICCVLIACAAVGFYFANGMHETRGVDTTAKAAYPMVNMQRLSQIKGPLYNGVSYRENYSKLAPVAERHKLFDAHRLPANEAKPASH